MNTFTQFSKCVNCYLPGRRLEKVVFSHYIEETRSISIDIPNYTSLQDTLTNKCH